ncbi:MAG: hypothetical protein PHQ60_08280 [Sideroxydans sp.]|nr:hypothetical protein [Sideroxydans sp.]
MIAPIRYFSVWTVVAYLFAPILGFITAMMPYYGGLAIEMAIWGGVLLTYLFTVIFAWPLFTLFRRMNYFTAWNFAIGGIICASPFSLLYITAKLGKFHAYSYAGNIVTSELIFFVHLLAIGLCSWLWFWFIGIWLPNHILKGDAINSASE